MPLNHSKAILVSAAILTLCPALAAGPTFRPDSTFKGSSLSGWRVLGQAGWRAENGELVGRPKPNGAGGWLMLDRAFQDVGFFTSFRCAGGCTTGILFRAERTAEGFKGIFISLSEPQTPSYSVSLDAQGRELRRELLRSVSGILRVAPPPAPNAPAPAVNAVTPAPPLLPPGFEQPSTSLRPGDWNEIEVLLDANIIRPFLNTGVVRSAVADEEFGAYGPFALYVGGAGEVRFRGLAYRDLGVKVTPEEKVSPRFRMQQINDMYYSWAAASADFNRDGFLDVAAGPYIYYGPDFTKSREFYIGNSLSPSKEFSRNVQLAFDWTGDGWPDILTDGGGAMLYVNPKGESRRWDRYVVVPRLQLVEVALLGDVDGDKIPEVIYCGGELYLRYAKPDPADATKPWKIHTVSSAPYAFASGVGIGDINSDGRPDLLNPYGWWEQPPHGSGQEPWPYHPQPFNRYDRNLDGGAGMFVYDVNGDGLNDVVAVLNAHTFGLGWYEQKRDTAGKISFVQHMISGDYQAKNAEGVAFSQAHGTTLADVDGDGVPDFIVGKRYGSHLDTYIDPDPFGDPVLYWYRTVRNPKAPGGAEFVPELIHNRSGAGSDLLAVDLNKDGAVDVVTSTNRGTFIFWGKPRAATPHE